jgi:hypothetical protein
MDAVSRSHAVNWSAEVHPLFEAKVAVLERNRGDRTAAIRRLRESKLRLSGDSWSKVGLMDVSGWRTAPNMRP